MNVVGQLRSPICGDVLRGAEDGAQDILGGIGLRAGGDRVGVRPVEVAEADGVMRYLGAPGARTLDLSPFRSKDHRLAVVYSSVWRVQRPAVGVRRTALWHHGVGLFLPPSVP
jgi:hypothetical protein